MLDLIQTCASDVHPVTMNAIIQQESGGNQFALNDNTGKRTYRPKTINEAAAIARKIIADGGSVDIGLAQINSKNLPRLKLTVEQVLDPCINLQASQTILKEGWERSGGDLVGTLSAYNTGKVDSSVGKKYAEKVFLKANYKIPAPGEGEPSIKKMEAIEPPVDFELRHDPFNSSLEPKLKGLEPSPSPLF